ncbi:glycosyltransferase family 2 protein, partial [Pseudomonas fluorescens]|uniref:glycosyltransferase family 2 protein n=1 Tax=Pseudomonas fluorescens TaxID=294 RepID=UPI00123F5047
MSSFKVACIIPTYNGKHELQRLLESLQKQNAAFDLYIVDSSSSGGTAELAHSFCSNFLSICKQEFNHGGTRQLMVERNPGYDIYIFLTQDAYLEDSHAITKILASFTEENVG